MSARNAQTFQRRKRSIAGLCLFLLSGVSTVFAADAPTGYAGERSLYTWRPLNPLGEGERVAVRDFLETPNGDIWIASDKGIARFDGRNWVWYTPESTAGVIPRSTATSLVLRSDGTLWASFWSDAVCWYDGREWHRGPQPHKEGPGNTNSYRLFECQNADLWLGLWRGPLLRMQDGSWVPVALPYAPDAHPKGVRSIAEGPDKTIWVLDSSGIFHRGVDENWRYISPPYSGRFTFPCEIVPLGEDEFLVVRYGSGPWWYRRGVWRDFGIEKGIPSICWTAALLSDSDQYSSVGQSLWLGTYGRGLTRIPFSLESWNTETALDSEQITSSEGLGHNVVYAIDRLRNGSIVAGTYRGASRFAPSGWSILGENEGLPSHSIRRLHMPQPGKMWAATDSGVVCIEHGKIKSFGTDSGLPSDDIHTLEVDRQGYLWCGTANGAARWTGENWQAIPRPQESQPFPVRALAWRESGELLAGTDSLGVWSYDGEWSQVTGAPLDDNGRPIRVEQINDIHVHADGTITVAANGLFRITPSGEWGYDSALNHPDPQYNQENNVYRIEQLDRNTLSYSSYTGVLVNYIDEDRWAMHNATTGMDSAWINAHRIAPTGVEWFATEAGVASFADGYYSKFTVNDGLPSEIVNDIEFDEWGRVWFATERGIGIYQSGEEPPSIRFVEPPREVARSQATVILAKGRDDERGTPSNLLTYRWRLDGGPWQTETGRCEIRLPPELAYGAHTVEAIANDRDHSSSPPAVHTFQVVRPLLARPSVTGPLLVLLIASVAAAAFAFLKHRHLAASQDSLREARDRALSADRMKSQFVATMSHELRTPLNSIIGYSELLLETERDTDKHEMLGYVHQSGRALLNLISDILDLSRIESGVIQIQNEPVDPRALAEEAIATVALRAEEKGLELASEIDESVPARIWLDPVRLRQILLNLLGNAVRFTEKGRICVKMRNLNAAGRRWLHILVEDTGAGIPNDRLEAIFEPFVQLDSSTTRAHGGTGLGLSICKKLLDVMGGAIEVESELGRGTCIRVCVPAGSATSAVVESDEILAAPSGATVPAERTSDSDSTHPKPADQSAAIWIAATPSERRLYLERLLRNLKYTPRSFDSGQDLLSGMSESSSTLPMAILIDCADGCGDADTLRARLREAGNDGQVALIGLDAADRDGFWATISQPLEYTQVKRLFKRLANERSAT